MNFFHFLFNSLMYYHDYFISVIMIIHGTIEKEMIFLLLWIIYLHINEMIYDL